MNTTKNMARKNLLVLLVAVFAVFLTATSVSAFGDITSVEVNGVEALGSGASIDFANIAGDRVPVLVRFEASDNGDTTVDITERVTIVAWISGERVDAIESAEFDVIEGRTYARTVYLEVPFDLDDDLHQPRKLEVVVESEQDGTADSKSIDLTIQRESFLLEILDADLQNEVKAGDSLVIDVVLKNRGSQFSEDTFLRVRIPELGLESRTYFGDLAPIDQDAPDKEDAVERRTRLKIPSNAPLGLYDVEIEAFNDDSFASLTRRVLIAGAEEDTMVVSSAHSRTFSIGEEGSYKLTIVNRGSSVRVYEISLNSDSGLNVDASDSVIVVPAGSSRTVEFTATSKTRDDYRFTAIVSSDGSVLSEQTFTADVEEANGETDKAKDDSGISFTGDNTAVLLTVILAIIFVVLLVVLIVLLTRKPEKAEEFGESYY
jgi:hypothetical protein